MTNEELLFPGQGKSYLSVVLADMIRDFDFKSPAINADTIGTLARTTESLAADMATQIMRETDSTERNELLCDAFYQICSCDYCPARYSCWAGHNGIADWLKEENHDYQ